MDRILSGLSAQVQSEYIVLLENDGSLDVILVVIDCIVAALHVEIADMLIPAYNASQDRQRLSRLTSMILAMTWHEPSLEIKTLLLLSLFRSG